MKQSSVQLLYVCLAQSARHSTDDQEVLCIGSRFITAGIRKMGEGNSFSLSVHTLGGGVPHRHTIILPLVPCPFWGYPMTGPRSLPSPGQGGTPSLVGGTPGWGTPLARDGVCPNQGWVPHSQGWGTPVGRDGVSPRDGVPPARGHGRRYASSIHAGGLSCLSIYFYLFTFLLNLFCSSSV